MSLEIVPRWFTKRIFGLHNLTYHQRLSCFRLESFELRRLRFDLVLVHKMACGLTGLRRVMTLFVSRSVEIFSNCVDIHTSVFIMWLKRMYVTPFPSTE